MDDWTTVDRKASKKKTSTDKQPGSDAASGEATSSAGSSDGWQQQSSSRDRRRKESAGTGRPDSAGTGGRGGYRPGPQTHPPGPQQLRPQQQQQHQQKQSAASGTSWASISAGTAQSAAPAPATPAAPAPGATGSRPSPWSAPRAHAVSSAASLSNGPVVDTFQKAESTPPAPAPASASQEPAPTEGGVRKGSWAALVGTSSSNSSNSSSNYVGSNESNSPSAAAQADTVTSASAGEAAPAAATEVSVAVNAVKDVIPADVSVNHQAAAAVAATTTTVVFGPEDSAAASVDSGEAAADAEKPAAVEKEIPLVAAGEETVKETASLRPPSTSSASKLSPEAPSFVPLAAVTRLSAAAPEFSPTLSPNAQPFVPSGSRLSAAAPPFVPPSVIAQLPPIVPSYIPSQPAYLAALSATSVPVASAVAVVKELATPVSEVLSLAPVVADHAISTTSSGDQEDGKSVFVESEKQQQSHLPPQQQDKKVPVTTTSENEQKDVEPLAKLEKQQQHDKKVTETEPEQQEPQALDTESDAGPGLLAPQQHEAELTTEPEQQQQNQSLQKKETELATIKETKAVIVTTVPDSNGNTVILDSSTSGKTAPPKPLLSPPPSPVVMSPGKDSSMSSSGRKQYDREFLLQLQRNPLSLQKPDLPQLEIVLPPASMRGSASAPQLSDLAASEYVRGSPAARRGDSRRRELPPPKKVISISREPVKLHQAENAWTPGAKSKAIGEQEADDELKALAKAVRSILNKLTPQKFDRLVDQFKELTVDTEEKLKLCTDLVFEKALDEPAFSVAYARMCNVLSLKKVPKADNSSTEASFRAMLITLCQREFEKDYITEDQKNAHAAALEAAGEDEEARKRLVEEFDALELKQRRRSLGNIRFIGELFKQKMIPANIMHAIIVKLLKATDEESLESLCQFLTTVGQILEEVTKQKMGTTAVFDSYFEQMAGIIQEKKTSSRVRFLMQDVIDLRRNNWVSRRKETGPKTIEEIHKEAKREAAIIELADAAPMGPPPSARRSEDRRRSRLEAAAAKAATSNDDGWSNVPSKAAKMMPEKLDSSRLRLSKVDTDQLQLGPPSARGFSTAWGRGSGAATKRSSAVEPPSPVRSSNRFQSLDDTDVSMPPPPSTVPGGGSGYYGRASEPVRRSTSRSSSRSGYNSSSRNPSSERRAVTPSSQQQQRQPESGGGSGLSLHGPADADADYLAAKFGPILEEYLSNCDYFDTVTAVCDLFRRDNIASLVELSVTSVLERSLVDQRRLGEFLARLASSSSRDAAILSLDQVVEGLSPILEIAEDMLVDIPKFWEYLAEMLAPLLVNSTSVDTFLSGCYRNLPQPALRDRFTVAALAAVQRTRPEALARILAQTGCRLDSQLSSGSLSDLLAANGIKPADLITNGSGVRAGSEEKKSEQQQLGDKLHHIFSHRLGVNEELKQVGSLLRERISAGGGCVETAVVRTLVTSLLESVIQGIGGPSSEIQLDDQLLKLRAPILKLALDTKDSQKDGELQLQALYAIQELVHRLEHPTKLLHTILELLYDLELISEESMLEWEASTDPEEQKGKGVALKSCTHFFKWLKEAEEEGEDESRVKGESEESGEAAAAAAESGVEADH